MSLACLRPLGNWPPVRWWVGEGRSMEGLGGEPEELCSTLKPVESP